MKDDSEYITLKWGTLKSWNVKSDKAELLLDKYASIGYCISAMGQRDTQEQKSIICELIDLMPGDIYLEWDGVYVSHDKAKEYIMGYGKKS